ncbi:MAG: reverse transcriptase family protein, partial [Bacteroidota bacterium]
AHFDLTLAQVDKKAAQLRSIRHVADLASLLKVNVARLKKFADKPHYHQFTIPKPGGQKRIIHNPHPELKAIQHTLNQYFQCLYHQLRTPAAYGFIPKPTDDTDLRNIYTNALQHLGAAWVLNLDLKDYFHTVNSRHLRWILRDLLEYPEPLTEQLSALISCKGVLPMGAPTSPVLSNLAAIQLDHELMQFAARQNAAYTRYVDDLTFSFDEEPKPELQQQIRLTAQRHGFRLNEKKIRLQPRQEEPEVTGLILKYPNPDVSKAFIERLKKDIKLLHKLTAPALMERGIFHPQVFEKLRQSIDGQLAFLKFIRGKKDDEYLKLVELAGA